MPLSDDPEARQRQLANLRPQPFPPAVIGNQRARVHGGFALTARGPVSEFMSEKFYDSLTADSPLRDDPKYAHLVALASGAFQRLADLKRHIDAHGSDIGSPKVQGWLDQETRLRRECMQYLQQLDMAPEQHEDALSAFVSDLRARVEQLRAARGEVDGDPLESIIDADVSEVE